MIIVDDSRKTVTVDKKEVDLTFTEYRVLMELSLNNLGYAPGSQK